METILLVIPNLVVDDDLDDDANVVLKRSSMLTLDVDVANVVPDATPDSKGRLAHRCESQSRHRRRCDVCSLEVSVDPDSVADDLVDDVVQCRVVSHLCLYAIVALNHLDV